MNGTMYYSVLYEYDGKECLYGCAKKLPKEEITKLIEKLIIDTYGSFEKSKFKIIESYLDYEEKKECKQ